MKPNLGGLGVKTTRQTATLWVRRGKSFARILTFYHEKAWPCATEPRPSDRVPGFEELEVGDGRGGTHNSVKHNCVCGFFPSRAFAFSLIPNGPAYSESINLITNHPLSMWQDQVSTFYLPTVQIQVQYHCGHKVQDSENITKHLKAMAAGGGK